MNAFDATNIEIAPSNETQPKIHRQASTENGRYAHIILFFEIKLGSSTTTPDHTNNTETAIVTCGHSNATREKDIKRGWRQAVEQENLMVQTHCLRIPTVPNLEGNTLRRPCAVLESRGTKQNTKPSLCLPNQPSVSTSQRKNRGAKTKTGLGGGGEGTYAQDKKLQNRI